MVRHTVNYNILPYPKNVIKIQYSTTPVITIYYDILRLIKLLCNILNVITYNISYHIIQYIQCNTEYCNAVLHSIYCLPQAGDNVQQENEMLLNCNAVLHTINNTDPCNILKYSFKHNEHIQYDIIIYHKVCYNIVLYSTMQCNTMYYSQIITIQYIATQFYYQHQYYLV